MTRQQAINAKCRDCIYDPASGLGNWRQQVGACAIESCPLWPYRPRSKPQPNRQRQVAGSVDNPAASTITRR